MAIVADRGILYAEQNCLDIAWAYADLRVVDLVKAKMDSLPKPKENKRGKAGKPQAKARPATTSAKEKVRSKTAPTYFILITLNTQNSTQKYTHQFEAITGSHHNGVLFGLSVSMWRLADSSSMKLLPCEQL